MQLPKFGPEDFDTKLCFACGEDNPIGLKLKPVYDGERVRVEFTAGEFYQGWKNTVHGGIVYTLLDEVTAYALLCCGVAFGVTAKSEIRFKQVTPLNEPIQVSAWIARQTKRLVETKGELALKDGTILAEVDSLFYVWARSKKTILWDMDGVIVDSFSFHFAAWREVFAGRGVDLAEKDFLRLFGTRNDFIIRSILGTELPQEDIENISEEKNRIFREKAKGNIKAFRGVIELLNALRSGNFKQAIVSSAPKQNIDLVEAELGLAGYFDCVVYGHEVAESKPSSQIYLLAAKKLEAEFKDCVVIEDSPFGVKAAKVAGMRCLAVTNTHAQRDFEEADRVVNSLEEIDLITLVQRV